MYNSTTKAIIFIGHSLDEIKAFPIEARREAGFQLDRVQKGYSPSDWKPMAVIGKGVREIRISEAASIYRVIYIAKFEEAVYVLHAFQKKTRTTSKQDTQIARRAYKKAQEGFKQ